MGTDIAVRDDHQPGVSIAPLENPAGFVKGYVAVADELAGVIRSKKLSVKISGRDYVKVEGWTLLGSMLGVFPVTEWSRETTEQDGTKSGWEARVEARTKDGAIIGAAEAECLYAEKTWAKRDDYALRSMAQTRATSKALRQPLGFVMTLAGFEATPAEEMPRDEPVVVMASAEDVDKYIAEVQKAGFEMSTARRALEKDAGGKQIPAAVLERHQRDFDKATGVPIT